MSVPSYDPAHFEVLFAAGERHFWFRHRNALLARVVRDEVRRLARPCRLLEMGCGAGNVLVGLERLTTGVGLLGLDLHQEGLACARRHVRRSALVRGDVGRAPFGPGTRFDLVGAFDGRDASDLVVNRFDAHPNEDAHRVAAEAVLRFLDAEMARGK